MKGINNQVLEELRKRPPSPPPKATKHTLDDDEDDPDPKEFKSDASVQPKNPLTWRQWRSSAPLTRGISNSSTKTANADSDAENDVLPRNENALPATMDTAPDNSNDDDISDHELPLTVAERGYHNTRPKTPGPAQDTWDSEDDADPALAAVCRCLTQFSTLRHINGAQKPCTSPASDSAQSRSTTPPPLSSPPSP